MKKTLARAQELRDQLMKVYADIHHTIEAGNTNLASLDSAESRAMLGPRAILEKRAEMRAIIDKTLEPLLAQLAAMKDEAEGLYEALTDPEVAARQASSERLTSSWENLPESTANTVLMANEVRDNIKANRTGRILADINELLSRSSRSRDLERLPMKELFNRLDATIAAGGEGMLRDVGLVLDELSHREMTLEDVTLP